jgi:hypothetical protein
MLRRILAALLVVALAWATRALRLQAFALHRASQRYEDVYYLPPAGWLPVLSLGFQAALADLIWCRSMIYFGEELGQRGKIKYIFEYTDAVLALDPEFRQAYRWAAVAAVYRPDRTGIADGMRGGAYLERALKRWPNDGELHWEYGSLMRFELAPLLGPGPQKDRLLALAAPHLAAAASLGAGPPWLALNSSSLLDRLGQTEQAIRHLEEVYDTIQDERTKRMVEERLAALRSTSFVEAFKAANASFALEHERSYPYLSPGLFMLVGQRSDDGWLPLLARRFLTKDRLEVVPTEDAAEQQPGPSGGSP